MTTHREPSSPDATISERLSETLERDGYVVLPRLLTERDVERLRALLTAPLSASTDAAAEFTARDRDVMYALVDSSEGREILVRTAGAIAEVLRDLHQDPFVEHTKALVKKGSAPWTPWHQDAAYWSAFDPKESMVTLWVALGPTTRETGCLRFVPGSQHGPILPHAPHAVEGGRVIDDANARRIEADKLAVDLEMQAGDGVMFRSRAVHGAHPNLSTEPRLAFKLVFQDAAKRTPGVPLHRTAMRLGGEPLVAGDPLGAAPAAPPTSLSKVISMLQPIRRLVPAPARKALRPLVRRLRGKPVVQLTDTFANLRRFQLEASEREWKQLCFYYEMIDLIDSVPGDVAEFGVSGGISLISWIRLLRIKERGLDGKERRHVFGFDSFEGLPALTGLDRSAVATAAHMTEGGFNDVTGQQALFEFIRTESHAALVKGWFSDTLPRFLTERPHTGFALVHVDCDLYESTKTVLDHVWDRVSPGGVVVFDELYHKDFPGETRAFQEFFPGKAFTLHRSKVKPDKKYIVKTT